MPHKPILLKTNERNGVALILCKILRIMPSVDIIEFGLEDIVRSGFVKEYLLAKIGNYHMMMSNKTIHYIKCQP